VNLLSCYQSILGSYRIVPIAGLLSHALETVCPL
jgi:hypothetical protein